MGVFIRSSLRSRVHSIAKSYAKVILTRDDDVLSHSLFFSLSLSLCLSFSLFRSLVGIPCIQTVYDISALLPLSIARTDLLPLVSLRV